MFFEIKDSETKEKLLPKKDISPEEALREDMFLASKAIRKGLSKDYALMEVFRVVINAGEFARRTGQEIGEVLGKNRRLLPRDGEDTTLLHVAAEYGHRDAMMQLLVNGKMDIDVQNTAGRTPLEETLYSRRAPFGELDRKDIEQIVTLLVAGGAKVAPEMFEKGLAVKYPGIRDALELGVRECDTGKSGGMRTDCCFL